ncbi:Hemin transport system ATP-binding protein hmuV [hydrothermal vent metagenome]|uniref:Hemin transport system ATP-binding protein hmuV n=1 Tax=hydrothermal vent metagenome TaxID=652676 RepID=A0A1W1EJ38_9ZZZZ
MQIQLKNYSNYILNDINLSISENLIILGSNGAGKSTLAKVLSGVIKNSSVYIDDININRINLKKRASLINILPLKII